MNINKKRWAKKLSLKIWSWLADHPEVRDKEQLPKKLYNKIIEIEARCPLCELYLDTDCIDCPLFDDGENCLPDDSLYMKWVDGDSDQNYAAKIRDKIKNWDIVEE